MVGVILMALVNTSNVEKIDNFHQPFSTLTKTIYININFNENRLLILKYILILHIKIGSNASNVEIDNFQINHFLPFLIHKIYININFNENRLLILKYILILHSKSCFYFKVHNFILHFLE